MTDTKTEFSDSELLRYSRHIMLPEVDVAGQLALSNGRALVIGMGGLGSPVALYLAASGVGVLTLVDDDQVEISNLQRQVIHGEDGLGKTKVRSAAEAVSRLNSDVVVEAIESRLDQAQLIEQVQKADVVLDCSDNFTTRQTVNRACWQYQTPLVSGAAIRMEGQVTVFDSRCLDSPCYQCLYDLTGDENLNCSQSGVLSPLVGVIGSLQALEALKLLAHFGDPLVGRLQLFDGAAGNWRQFRLKKDPQCVVCGSGIAE